MRSALPSALKICAALLALAPLADSAWARDRSEVPRGAGTFTRNFGAIGGRDRLFTVYAPKDLKPGAPLVLVFHGGGGGGTMGRLGTRGGFDFFGGCDGLFLAHPQGRTQAGDPGSKGAKQTPRR